MADEPKRSPNALKSGEVRALARDAIGELRESYEREAGCSIDMRDGCVTHDLCVRGDRIAALWRLLDPPEDPTKPGPPRRALPECPRCGRDILPEEGRISVWIDGKKRTQHRGEVCP